MSRPSVYLDWNATAPPLPEALEACARAAADAWANPSSTHRPGQRARAALDGAREAVAALVGWHPGDVVLTSGGTEANNLALETALTEARPALALAPIEHPSITAVAQRREARGLPVAWLPVDPGGRVVLEGIDALLNQGVEGAPLGAVALAPLNHETGVRQPLEEVVARVAAHDPEARPLVLADIVQAAGKIDPAIWQGADLLTLAAHKLRGPKGIGALVARSGVKIHPLLVGGEQERGLRPGTQGADLAAGFRVAATHARAPRDEARLSALRDRLESGLRRLAEKHGIRLEQNGAAPRAAHVSNLSWLGLSSPELCAALDLEGVAAATGSACSAGTATPSKVIASFAGTARAASAVRLSLGETTSEADIDAALAAFALVLSRTVLETT